MSGKWTPGPWAWFGNADGLPEIFLATKHSGHKYVMGFRRWGMRGAQPCFQPEWGLKAASELIQFVVGDKSIVGIEAAKKDPSVYRYQIRGIAAPDACLIATSPELAEALEVLLSDARDLLVEAARRPDHKDLTADELEERGFAPDSFAKARAALAKAMGEGA